MTTENYKYENGWHQYKYPHFAVTADCVVFGYKDYKLHILLVERGGEPYKGMWALPGGFLSPEDASIEECARRELQEETSFRMTGKKDVELKQFHVFSDAGRDPRERVLTTAFYTLVRTQNVKGGDDAKRAEWFPLDELPELAFDHQRILDEAQDMLRKQIYFEPIGFDLLPTRFTIKELQTLYEEILGVGKLDRRNFYNKITKTGLLEQLDEKSTASKRPASLFRFNKKKYDELKKGKMKLEF